MKIIWFCSNSRVLEDRIGFPFIFGIRKMRIIWERSNDVKVNSHWSQDIYSIWFTTSCRSSPSGIQKEYMSEFHESWYFTTVDMEEIRRTPPGMYKTPGKQWNKLPFPQLVSLPDCWTSNSMFSLSRAAMFYKIRCHETSQRSTLCWSQDAWKTWIPSVKN